MNNIITLRRLSEQIAKEAGVGEAQAEEFIKALTAEVRAALADGENVRLRGIGEFKMNEGRLSYTPTTELAEAINAPFSMFSPEELDPDITAEDLKNSPQTLAAEKSSHNAITTEGSKPAVNNEVPAPAVENIQEPTPIIEEIDEPAPAVEHVETPAAVVAQPVQTTAPKTVEVVDGNDNDDKQEVMVTNKKAVSPVVIQPFDDDDNEEEYEPMQESVKQGFPTFWVAWGAVFGLIIGLGVGFFVHDPIERMLEPTLDEEYMESYYDDEDTMLEPSEIDEDAALDQEAQAILAKDEDNSEAIAEAPAAAPAPAPAPAETQDDVYDTIHKGNSLGSLAKKHYGSNIYWVYIYMENQAKINNPNKVSEGTTLKIPPLSKYATKATEAENKADAQKKVNEILSKYPK